MCNSYTGSLTRCLNGIVFAGLVLIISGPAIAQAAQERVAYYGNWSIYGNGYTLKDVDTSGAASRITTLMYAFENVSTTTPYKCFQTVSPVIIHPQSHDYDGTGAGDAWADYQVMFDEDESVSGEADDSEQALRGNFNQILQLKEKYPNLKVMVSIGGWTFSKFLSDAAMSTSSRETFVSSCIDMFIHGDLPTGIAESNAGGDGVALGVFDGIDIDWEYPATPGNTGNHYDPADTENFTKLLAEFRDQLDDAETTNGVSHYYLTAAVPAGGEAMSNIETDKIEEYLDWIGVMTYDMHGAWETAGPTTFQAPLFPSASPASTTLSVAESAQKWLDGGWPKNKMVIGVPFYWRGWGDVGSTGNGLYQSSAAGTQIFELSELSGVAHYKELLGAGLVKQNYLYYDSTTHSPWIYNGDEFWTGDTPATLTEKAAWIRDEGYLGAMIYSLESDDPSATLVKAVYKGLTGGVPAPIPSAQIVQQISRTSISSPNTATNGEPINMIGGNYLATRNELRVPGRDLPVAFTLNYNSASAGELGPMGYGWTHNYWVTAATDTDSSVVITGPDGRLDRFTPNVSGGYDAPDGIFDVLTHSSSTGNFELVRKNGSIFTFNQNGMLATIESPNGNIQTLEYNADNFLSTTTDAVGREFTFAYNDIGQLTTVADPEGREVSYAYDAQGNLTHVTNPENDTTTYLYDAYHRIVEVIDPLENSVVNNVYDSDGRVVAQTNALGDTVTLQYATGTTAYVDARGATTTYHYDNNLRLTEVVDANGGTTSINYDASGNPEEVTNPRGYTTTRSYDNRGNLIEIENPIGDSKTFTYDASDNLLSVTDELNRTTRYYYDVNGNITHKVDAAHATTTFTYDAHGQMTVLTDPLGHVSEFEYDSDGNLVTLTDGVGRNMYFGYDAVGQLVAAANDEYDESSYDYDSMRRIVSITDPLGGTTTIRYDGNGNRTGLTDANGHTTTYEYDANQNLIEVTNELDDATVYEYDENGNLVSKTDADNHETTYAYDLLNRRTQTTDPLGNETSFAYDANGNLTARIDASDRETTFTYDSLDRLTVTTYPNNARVVRTYDDASNLLTVAGAVGTSTYTYDVMHRLTSETDPHGNTVAYDYDANGNLIEVTYPDSKVVTYAYTAANQLGTTTDWNGARTVYTYDANARLASKKLPNGITGTYTYNENGLLTRLVYTKGGTLVRQFDYYHDETGKVVDDTETLPGSIEWYTGYTYDAVNRLTLADAPTHTYAYTYDAVGNITTSVADGATSTHTHNNANELTALDSRSFTYDAQGNRVTDGSGAFAFDYDNRLTAFSAATGVATATTHTIYADSTSWSNWSWGSTVNLNETAVKYSGSKSIKTTYTQAWGGLYLRSSAGVSTATSTHLHFAIRSSTANPTVEIDAYGPSDTLIADILVSTYLPTMATNTWYVLDIPLADLNATSTNLTGFVAMRSNTGVLYFDDVKLIAVAPTYATTTLVYDALGNRIEKNVNGTSTYSYTNAFGEQVLVTKYVPTTTYSYNLYGLDRISEGGTASTSRTYYLTDGLGNVRYLTNSAGAIVGEYTYDPYGKLTAASGTATTYAFQSEQKDVESGLVYLRARYYDPTTGRFVSRDPFPGTAEDPAGQNGYNYANGDPVNLTDKDGESPLLITGLLGAGGGIVGQFGYDVYNNVQAGGWGRAFSKLSGGDVYLTRAIQGGAIGLTGGVAGTLTGVGIFGQSAIVSGASGAIGVVGSAALGEPITIQSVLTDTLIGGLTFGLAGAVPRVPGRLPNLGTKAFYTGKHTQYNAQLLGVEGGASYLSNLLGGAAFSQPSTSNECAVGSLR